MATAAPPWPGNSSSPGDNSTAGYDDDYEYEYDYEESLQTFNWPELLPALVVYGLTMALGIVGNSLIIFTIGRYRRMKSTTNVFLVSLACADLLLILICIPVKLAKLFSFTWTMGEFMCKTVHYMQNVSAICSVLTLTAMSIERYYAIVHPMKAKYLCTISQARKIILCIWVAAFLLAVPMLFAQVHMEVGLRVKGYWCVKYWDNLPLWRFHEVYMLLLILVVPTTVMAVAYTSICWEIWRVMQQRCEMTTGQGFMKNGGAADESYPLKSMKKAAGKVVTHQHSSFKESMKKNALKAEEESKTVKQVVKMLVAVVVLFVICWAPCVRRW
ncbi:QRFP-like peptide receptor isoform X2 [Bacillus rossius redtenbacheri]|uniref:QRFP-like peptide receptor isoform X2 n=1 Tax=Bacillus rossius redtenbacheri TaxID=93214 RepID=UPI002FDC82F7